MGCIGSRLAILKNHNFISCRGTSRRQNTFPVLNVDDMGRQISPGKLEVTETDLVLHVRGKPSLTWPLRCLRRYGYDDELFSFESGRRCPTGAGIFAFRCNRAQSLFNLLQSKIQGNPGTAPNTVPTTPITPTNTGSNNPTTPVSSTFVYVNLAENNSNRQTTNAPDVTQVSGSVPLNQTGLGSLNSTAATNCGSVFPLPLSYKQTHPAEFSHPVYMNVDGPKANSSHSQASSYQNHVTVSSQSWSKRTSNEGAHQSGNSATVLYQNATGSKLQTQKSLDGYQYPNYEYSRHNNENGGGDCTLLYTNVICSQNTDQSTLYHGNGNSAAIGGVLPAEVNYAELDLKTDNQSSSCTNSLSTMKSRLNLLNGRESNWPGASDPKQFKIAKLTSGCKGIETPSGNLGGTSQVMQDQTNLTSPTGSSKLGELGYATIDFDRTAALSVVTRTKINLDFHASSSDDHEVTTRKTRHNSTAL